MRIVFIIVIAFFAGVILSTDMPVIPKHVDRIKQIKDWGALDLPDRDLTVQVYTRWRAGKLYYKIIVSPYASLAGIIQKMKDDPDYRKLSQHFTVKFFDEYGFIVKGLRADLEWFTDILDNDGKRSKIIYNASMDCTRADYQAIKRYNVAWALDLERIPKKKEGE